MKPNKLPSFGVLFISSVPTLASSESVKNVLKIPKKNIFNSVKIPNSHVAKL